MAPPQQQMGPPHHQVAPPMTMMPPSQQAGYGQMHSPPNQQQPRYQQPPSQQYLAQVPSGMGPNYNTGATLGAMGSVGVHSAPTIPPPPTQYNMPPPSMPPPPTAARMPQEPQGALPAPAPPRTYPVSDYGGAIPGSGGGGSNSREPSPRDQVGLIARTSPPGSSRGAPAPGVGLAAGSYKAAAASSATSRIDPGQMPRPPRPHIGALFETLTNSRKTPPVANTSMSVVDSGYASPRFLRTTMASPPVNAAMQQECVMPFAFLTTPFAHPEGCSRSEQAVPVVRSVEDNPVRCETCRGYVNPGVTWLENGASWECNLCKHVNTVPDYYYSSLDGTGLRMDRMTRPELSYGSVDFQVSGDYCIRPVQEPVYIFAIDISAKAVQSGATFASLQSVESCIKRMTSDALARAAHAFTKVGIFTYNRMIQFFSVDLESKSEEGKVKMHVADAWDPICAIPPSQWIKGVVQDGHEIQVLLQRLPELIATEQNVDDSGYATASMSRGSMKGSCTGAAMKSACDALTGLGGKVVVLSPNGPNIGHPQYSRKEEMGYYPGPYELKLYCDAETYATLVSDDKDIEARAAFAELGKEASAQCLSYDFLLLDASNKNDLDTAVLSDLCDATGGSFHRLVGSISDEENVLRLERQLWHCIERYQGADAIVKVRSSPGLSLDRFLGGKGIVNFDKDLELGGVDEDTTFGGLLSFDTLLASGGGGKIKDDEKVYLQVAVLYTDRYMRRMVRVHNLGLKASSSHTTVFRYCDLDVLAHTMMSMAAERALKTRLIKPAKEGGPRGFISELSRDILHAYRVHCSPNSPRGQLILPDSLKLLPLYSLGLLKHPSLMDNADLKGKAPYVRGMERAYELRRIRNLALRPFINSIYPRLINLLDLDESYFNGGGSDDEDESVWEGAGGAGGSAMGDSALPYGGGAPGPDRGSLVMDQSDPAGATTEAEGQPSSSLLSLSSEQKVLLAKRARQKARSLGDKARALASVPRAPCVGSEALQSDACYLLDEGSTLYLYVGRTITRMELEEWFSVPPHARPSSVSFNADSHTASLMRTLIENIQATSICQPELVVIWADEPSSADSTRFALRLVEDSIYGTGSYTDHLCKLHTNVQTLLRREYNN